MEILFSHFPLTQVYCFYVDSIFKDYVITSCKVNVVNKGSEFPIVIIDPISNGLLCCIICVEFKPYQLVLSIISIFEQETYPQSAPIWFSEDDDTIVSNVISRLSEAPPDKNNVRQIS